MDEPMEQTSAPPASLRSHPRFWARFQQLADVGLNPRRHTAAHARAHSEAVAARARALGARNGCREAELILLENLGLAHDLGKVTGTARPEKSLEVLREDGVDDAALLALVKWHDTNLPWYLASTRGQAPSDKAWRRLASEVDLRLLTLFMVADRVDAPPGWRRNAPLLWFLEQVRARGLVGALELEVPEEPSEVCAGAALLRGEGAARQVLVIRVRGEGFELPKGGVEWDELPEEAAVRELREEAGVRGELVVGRALGHLDYVVGEAAQRRTKRVRYYAVAAAGAAETAETAERAAHDGALGPLPGRTRARRWLGHDELAQLELVNEELRPLLRAALEAEVTAGGTPPR